MKRKRKIKTYWFIKTKKGSWCVITPTSKKCWYENYASINCIIIKSFNVEKDDLNFKMYELNKEIKFNFEETDKIFRYRKIENLTKNHFNDLLKG